MSSDLYTFDIPFPRHSDTDNMVSYDANGNLMFFSDPCSFPFLTGSPVEDLAQGNISNSLHPSFSSFSPQENESLCHANLVQPLSDGPNIKCEFTSFSALHGCDVTSEECQMGVDYSNNQHFLSQTCHASDSASKVIIQRSFSCNSFGGKLGFPFEPHPDTPMDSSNFQWHALNSPEKSFFTGQMRRVCSTGDLQNTSQMESPLLEEAYFKVGRYSAEERKEKISKYRAKRSQRKFNKIIKYACRKTLADNRTRIRGRFARNDEISEIPKAPSSTSTTEEYEHEFWVEFIEGLNEEVIG